MLALHTSDWHLGRALHGFDLADAQAAFVDHLVGVVNSERVDLVIVSGDVHDRAIPPVAAMRLFDEALYRLRDTGAEVVVISGNHDGAQRLGDKAGLLDPRIRIRTRVADLADPVVVTDADGPVRVYPVPYLEPAAVAGQLPLDDPDSAPDGPAPGCPGDDDEAGRPRRQRATHASVMRRAMAAVHADLAQHPGRSIVVGHAWVTGGRASDSERDVGVARNATAPGETVGGLDAVPESLFDGITYTALGHLHRPQALRENIRYSGSPLAYSFSEASDSKSCTLVELTATGTGRVEHVPVPVHRRMSRLTGALAELTTSAAYADAERDFVAAVLTDPIRPTDAMTTLRRRFPFAATLTYAPTGATDPGNLTFGRRVQGRSDLAVAESFVSYVRHVPPAPSEMGLLAEALDAARLAEEAA
jgi:exonuclease SbcD